ncbi:MAG TPA: helix-turn-helix domain-containing protein [Treponema sp.]|nr:helix-turn-helix domain-containing protein [Treponema sp.]
METHVVVFMENSKEERNIISSLKTAGIRISKARSFGELHSYFSSTMVAAVVIPLSITHRYHINPRNHLYEAKSPIAIITWNSEKENTIETKIFCMREGSNDDLLAAENLRKAEKISLLVRASGVIEEKVNVLARDCSPAYVAEGSLLPELTLHRKMRSILEVIAAAGYHGISSDDIIQQIWPDSHTDRLHDLQSYISKLRSSLQAVSNFNILYKDKQYSLVSNGE